MRTTTRLAALAGAGLLALAGSLTASTPASAAPALSISGLAPANANGPGNISFSYTVVAPDALTDVSITTHQSSLTPASLDGALLDGDPIPSLELSQPTPDDLAVTVPTLAAGVHRLVFSVPISDTASGAASSTATVAGDDAGTAVTATSDPVVVQVNQPDLSVVLTPDTGESETAGLLGTGGDLYLQVDVANYGYGRPTASLTITFPGGMTLGADGVFADLDGSGLPCAPEPAHTVRCDLGAIPRSAGTPTTLDIDLTTEPYEPIGSTVPVTVQIAPDAGSGTESDQSNNTATAQVTFTGSARLSYSITASSKRVVVGHSVTVNLTVHNSGPQPAPQTLGIAIVIGDAFRVVDFSGGDLPQPDAPEPTRLQLARASLRAQPHASATGGVATAPTTTGGTGLIWYVGDIPVGGSSTATLTLVAAKPGTAQLQMLAISGATDPNCPDLECDPPVLTLAAVRAGPGPAAPSTATAAPVAAPSAATGGLAATGPSRRPAVIGLGFLLAGAVLVRFGRRRARRV